MIFVRQILNDKGHDVWSVSADTTVFDALKLMAEKYVGALLVLENGEIAGIFSERDYARKVILHGKASKDTPISEIMTTDVLYVTPEQTVEECMELMSDKRIRHLPVLENNTLTGIISIGDVVRATIEHKDFTIKQLEHYIHGTR